MKERTRIEGRWNRVFYLPLAIIQWGYLTAIMGGIGIITITPIGGIAGLICLMMLDTENAKMSFLMASAPVVCTFMWWYDYVTKGEIRMYD